MSIKKLNEIVDSPVTELATTVLDALQTVPLGGIVVSLYKTVSGIADYLLFKKFARFLEPMSGMEIEVDEYIERLSTVNRKKLGEYMISLLAQTESTEKAQLMGYIFKSAVRDEIDYIMMLRLVSIIGRAFVFDLKELPRYIDETRELTIAYNTFINLGLIDNETGGYWKGEPTVVLNEVGLTLCQILDRNGWFKPNSVWEDKP